MIRSVIVEDEQKAREALKSLLSRYCPEVMVCAEANGVESGRDAINEHNPDLVFLDIEMSDGSGFRLLEKFENNKFEVIFTTAFEQFAIKAIRYQALDYLLKPIVPEELIAAVDKVKILKAKKNSIKTFESMLTSYGSMPPERKKISLATSDKIHIVDIEQIVRCESDNYYTHFYFTNGKHLLISKTLKEVEGLLEESDFIRPHKSHLINIHFIQNFVRDDGGYITLTDGSKIPVSRRKKEKVLEIIHNL